MIKIIQKGILTTVQDGGRWGYQKYGVPVCGAMDPSSAALANILVGNPIFYPILEITVKGPDIEVQQDCCVALTGGEFDFTVNGAPCTRNKCYFAPKGSVVSVGFAREGARGFLAFSGGIDVPKVMGSASTYIKGGFGGLNGRALADGDVLPLGITQLPANVPAREVGGHFLFRLGGKSAIRLIEGPQADEFAEGALGALCSGEYTISLDSDRMGYRLSGPEIPYKNGFDGNIISDGIAMGSVQVAKGQPIILLADRQTTGGYAKIAGVIGADLMQLAQKKGGDKITFMMTDIETAHAEYREIGKKLDWLTRRLDRK